jgi:hypothetical protein
MGADAGRGICGIALAVIALTSGPALAQVTALDLPYPASSTSKPVVQAWIDRYLPKQGYVVGAWSANVVMLVSVGALQADRYPQVTTEVLSEVLRPDAANAAGWRAALQTEAFACDRDQYQVQSSLYFARGDRKGGFDEKDGGGAWLTPEPDATMDTVERTACFWGKQRHDQPATGGAGPPGASPAVAAASAPKASAPTPVHRIKAKPPSAKRPAPGRLPATHSAPVKAVASKPAATLKKPWPHNAKPHHSRASTSTQPQQGPPPRPPGPRPQ